MIYASNQYKSIMADPYRYRPRGHMTVSISAVNNEAQAVSSFSDDCKYAYWSNLINPLRNKRVQTVYATMEQNFFKADGSQYILPEESDEYFQLLLNTETASKDLMGAIKIILDKKYEIKGLTIDFGNAYPTAFSVESADYSYMYEITNGFFETTDLMGDTDYIIITPISMVGGAQRLRINNILMGVGLNYTNAEISSASYSTDVDSFATELPSYSFSLTIFDENQEYDVDNNDSFANFLHTKQDITISAGLELDDGTVEWIQMAKLLLATWKSQKGKMSFTAKDRFAFMDDTYTLGNYIGEKVLYDVAESVLQDAGFEADEYEIDEYLRDVIIKNPIPEKKHKECLQLIANAARCKLYQNNNGKICITANFANVLEPEDVTVVANDETAYSKPENAVLASNCEYATMEQNFFRADGTMYILPEGNGPYLETSYTSDAIADGNGLFDENPRIMLTLPAAYSFYTISVSFYGNAPKEMKVITYMDDVKQSSVKFHDLGNENLLNSEFLNFNRIVFEFTETRPYNRVSINRISFGDLSDYMLTRHDMMEEPVGYRNEMIKTVSVRVCSFVINSQGSPQQIDDSAWVENEINSVGIVAKFENPLIGTEEHAQLVNEWLSENMKNNVTYNIKYRGEPRIEASDIIFMEGLNRTIQCEVESHNFTFNGAFSGTLALRKMKATEEKG